VALSTCVNATSENRVVVFGTLQNWKEIKSSI
jgi:hypothetical protein